MCGIAGILTRRAACRGDLGASVAAMADAVAHRGPDDAGVWVDHEDRGSLWGIAACPYWTSPRRDTSRLAMRRAESGPCSTRRDLQLSFAEA